MRKEIIRESGAGGARATLPTSHPYDELPQPNEMKTALVRKVTDNARVQIAPEERAETGTWVLVPQHWPGECDIVLTATGYYAEFKQGPLFHQFHVWPVRRREEAEDAYERARCAGGLDPSVIARTTHLPDPAPRERKARAPFLGRGAVALPRYVSELAGLCGKHGIEHSVDAERKTLTMKLPAEIQSYTGALTAAVADARSHHPGWTITF